MPKARLSLLDAVCIGLGGMLGSIARTWLASGYEGLLPVPTILANCVGAMALALLHVSQHRIHPRGRYLYMVGFCGSFTTVSTFSYETLALFEMGSAVTATANLAIPLMVAFAMVYLIVDRLDQPAGDPTA